MSSTYGPGTVFKNKDGAASYVKLDDGTYRAVYYDGGTRLFGETMIERDYPTIYFLVHAEPVAPLLPTTLGSTIKVTRWARETQDDWYASLGAGGWRISADRTFAYTAKDFEQRAREGALEFEVVFTPPTPSL